MSFGHNTAAVSQEACPMHQQPGYALERLWATLYDWLKRHASLQAKVLPLKPVAFTCRLQSGMSCNHVQNCMATAPTLPQLSRTGQGLNILQTLCLCWKLSLACWDDHMGACSMVMISLCSAEHGLCIGHLTCWLGKMINGLQ